MSMHTHFWGKKTLSEPPFLCAVYRMCFYGLREIACSSGPLPQGDSGNEALENRLKHSLDVVMGESRPLPGSGGLLPCTCSRCDPGQTPSRPAMLCGQCLRACSLAMSPFQYFSHLPNGLVLPVPQGSDHLAHGRCSLSVRSAPRALSSCKGGQWCGREQNPAPCHMC